MNYLSNKYPVFALIFLLFLLFIRPLMADDVKVGLLLPLTGKLASFGEMEKNAFLMAAEEINAAGGIYGENMRLIIEDTAGIPANGQSAVKKLIFQDKVLILGGGYSSSVTWKTMTLAQKQEVPFLINTSSADKITERGKKYIFRLNQPASGYFEVFASFIKKELQAKNFAIVHEDTQFGHSRSNTIIQQLNRLNLTLVIKCDYTPGRTDHRAILENIRDKQPELLYLISNDMNDAVLLVNQAREIGLTPKLIVGGTYIFSLPEFRKNAMKGSEYVCTYILWSPFLPYIESRLFFKKYIKHYQITPDYHAAQAYSAMYVIRDALLRSKTLTSTDIRDALSKTNLDTVFGPVKFISYNKKTQQNRLPVLLGQWQKGRLEIIWPRKLASQNFQIYPRREESTGGSAAIQPSGEL